MYMRELIADTDNKSYTAVSVHNLSCLIHEIIIICIYKCELEYLNKL